MITLVWDSGFTRSYKKRIRPDSVLRESFWDAMEVFAKSPFHPYLKTHKLTGKLHGFWAFSVSHDYRVVFKFLTDNKSALLIDVGTHEEVY